MLVPNTAIAAVDTAKASTVVLKSAWLAEEGEDTVEVKGEFNIKVEADLEGPASGGDDGGSVVRRASTNPDPAFSVLRTTDLVGDVPVVEFRASLPGLALLLLHYVLVVDRLHLLSFEHVLDLSHLKLLDLHYDLELGYLELVGLELTSCSVASETYRLRYVHPFYSWCRCFDCRLLVSESCPLSTLSDPAFFCIRSNSASPICTHLAQKADVTWVEMPTKIGSAAANS
ncbi:hypothetical protein BG015_000869 [Linnemannia schmuckeri]|uniref:Uncharacterized protein n=1 Tax=Linnemannia schmuckeri TaxID=64567 RepID=A0A9P5S7E3_9FUNG|nr:hypothetical protein BG015_000869 [Linnemannia schmuckeri]